MNKIKKFYKKIRSEEIRTEGIYYDINKDKYIVETYLGRKTKIIGKYNKLNEAKIAKESYEKALIENGGY